MVVDVDHEEMQKRDHDTRLARSSVEITARKPTEVPAADEDLGIITGIVKRFGDYAKPGYGHLIGPNKEEYFVHYTDISSTGFKNLASGQHVTFRAFSGKRGLYAKEVKVFS